MLTIGESMEQNNELKTSSIGIPKELDQQIMAVAKKHKSNRSEVLSRFSQICISFADLVMGPNWANAKIVPGHEEGSLGRSIALDEAALLCVKYDLYVPDVEELIDNIGDEVLASNVFDDMEKEGREKEIDIFEEDSPEVSEVLKHERIKALVKRISIAQQTKVQFNKEE
jgi:hypothetical protein